MIKIAIDAMGGDNGSKIVVEAVKKFKKEHEDVEFFVTGKQEELNELGSDATIIDARDVMGMEEGALEIMRKKETSMMKAINLVADHTCDGVVTCGSTGAYLSGATIKLKQIPGILRAALISPFPTVDGKGVTILDIGANNENTPEQLAQFAIMGNVYSKCVMGVENPRVCLLSNGTEEKKGSPVVKHAHQLIKENKNLNFCGNIEGRDVLLGTCDVVVSEGYPGNVLLKSIEGTASVFNGMIKKSFKRNIFSILGYLLASKGFKEMKQNFDYKKFGGAMLVGVNGVVVKGHGNSDAYSFYNAIKVCYNMIKMDVIEKIKKEINVNEEL